MVNLSIDPPPFGREQAGPGPARYAVVLALLVVAFGGGFLVGRKTAGRPLRAPKASSAVAEGAAPPVPPPAVAKVEAPPPAPAQGASPAVAPAPAPAAAPALPATAAAAAPVTAAAPAAPSAPAAPQGPLVRRLALTLQGPLEESVTAALPANERAWAEQLTQVVNRILVWSMQVSRDARRGDRLEVLYELPSGQPVEAAPPSDGPETKEPVVLALRYNSQKLGRLLTAYRFKPDGSTFAHYYTGEGVDVEEHLLDSPVLDYEQITSLLRDGRHHKGVDFKTPVGTLVHAPFDGQVVRRNWHFAANGNCLELVDGKSGRHVIFLHLEAAPKEMQPGRAVKKGEVVARSGNSGHSTAPHLHYQLEAPDGRVLDPFAVLPTRKVVLEGSARAAFDAERSRLDPLLVAGF